MASNSSSEYKVVTDKVVSPDEDIIVKLAGAMYKDSITEPNRYANISDIGAVGGVTSAVRFSPTFQATGLTFTGTGATYPTYDSYYVRVGQMVTFTIHVTMGTVTNFGTGQFKVDMPFAPLASEASHFSAWTWVNPALPPDELNGHIQLVADHLPGSQTLDLHWLQATTANPKPIIETIFSQGSPVTLTTASKIYINGTYIAVAS
jgi:hypothetical protein